MNKTFGNDDPGLERYIASMYQPDDEVLHEIRTRSAAAGLPDIQLAALDARHLEILARATAPRRAVEIGSLGGYSGVCLLRGLADGGQLDTFEIDPAHARVAEESYRRAGFAGRARVHVGPALEKLPTIEAQGPFDLCFIDADKESYPAYVDWAARHLRRGGLLIVDNTFLFGRLVTGTGDQVSVAAMRAVHERLARGDQFRSTVLPTGEGMSVAVRV